MADKKFVLLRPPQLLIVCGCEQGVILIAKRPSLIRKMAQGMAAIVFSSRRTKHSVLRWL